MGKVIGLFNKNKAEDEEPISKTIVKDDEGNVLEHEELDELANNWCVEFMNQLYDADIGGDTDEELRDQSYFFEALKALLYRAHDVKHPFHEMIDKCIRVQVNEDGSFDAWWINSENEESEDDEELDE